MPAVMKRVAAVSQARLNSPTKSVQAFAEKPTLFTQDRQPEKDYLGVPEVSSERRRFIPIAFLSADTIASNKVQIVEGATHYHFGMLCSTMHNAWMRTVAGRLESRYSYAPAVYNNFPWPTPTDKQRTAIEAAAHFYKIPPERVLVLFDDISLPVGKLRIRKNGSAGGHNGLKSIISCLGSDQFPRVKIGVGAKPHPDYDLADWVLSTVSKTEWPDYQDAMEHAAEAALCIVKNGCEKAAAEYNGKRF